MWRFLLLLLPLSALVYALWHVWCLLPFHPVWRTITVSLCALAFLSLFLSVAKTLDAMPMGVAEAVYRTGTTSLIVLLYLTIIFLILDILRLVHAVPPSLLRNNIWTASAITAVLLAVFICGNIRYHHKIRRKLTLKTDKNITRKLTLVMMSDLHLGYHIRRNELRKWVDMINKEHPDMVLFGGDVVDRSMKPLIKEGMAAELKRINAPVYACFGNHEYYCGADKAARFYREAGIVLLRDSVVTDKGICVIGRDDRTNKRRKSVETLMKNVNGNEFIILLDHQPYDLPAAADAGIDFQFSGHTHHGQVFPASLITDLVYTIAHGEYAIGGTRYYVSSGMGIWGGKFRIGTCSEYVVATIEHE